MTPVLGSETYGTYVDVDVEVKPWLVFTGASTTRDFALNLITDAVCAEAQRYLGRPIQPTEYSPADGLGKFDGSGGLNSGYIMLPRVPIISIQSVIEYQGSNPVALSEVDPSTGNTGGDGYQCNYRTGRLTRVLGGIWNRPFYPGSNNIWVTWTAGYNPIPKDLLWATLEWIAHVFRNTQQATWNDPHASGDVDELAAAGLWAGLPQRVQSVLDSYARIGMR